MRIEVSEDDVYELVNKNPIVLLCFYIDGIEVCEEQSKVFEELESGYGEKVVFAEISYDDNPDIVDIYKIKEVPTIIIFINGKQIVDPDGKRDRIIGVFDKERIEYLLNAVLKKVQT